MSTHAYFRNVSDNVRIENGKLMLMAKYEGFPTECCHWGNPNDCHDYLYSSGYITSVNKIQYGYLEMKCYIPDELALNPCFWLFGNADPYEYDEIDVFERFGNPLDLLQYDHSKTFMQNFYHNPHEDYSTGRSDLRQDITFSTLFVGQEATYAVEWLPEEIHYYVNGQITRSVRYSSRTDHNSSSYFTCTDFLDAIPMWMQFSFSVNHAITPNTDLFRLA
jgi:beta-glucanase (GH16 family)